MPISANLLRAAFILFAAGVWGLTLAALDGRGDAIAASALALLGAAILASREGKWIAVGAGASLASVSALTIGSTSAALALVMNVAGVLLVTGAGLGLALELLRKADAAARPVVVGVVGFLVADYAVVHVAATGGATAFAAVLPAAALLPLAYGACAEVLKAAPAPAVVSFAPPERGGATTR